MASPLIRVDDSSLRVRDVIGNNNEVYLAKFALNFESLKPEFRQTLEEGLNRIMREKLIHESQADQPPLAVEGADVLALHEPLQELASALLEEEVNRMITMFCMTCQVPTRPACAQDLFASMIHRGKLRLQDITFLQSLLWKAGRSDLFKSLAERARELQEIHEDDDPPLRISHLDAPSLVPIEGYKYVKFHLKVDLLDIGSERLQKLEGELARLLGVPRKCIAVMGVEPDQSAWVTVILPTAVCKVLEIQFDLGAVQNFLLSLDIDKVAFFPDPGKGEDKLPLSCTQQSKIEWNPPGLFERQGGAIPIKEGRLVEGAVFVTFKVAGRDVEEPQSPKPQSVHVPVGLLKDEMEDMLGIEAEDQVWIYQGQELDDREALEHYVGPTVSHVEILVKERSPSLSD